ncbi:MAG: hypothetical protein IT372_31720 [Polyangiaceae bacterium]|nr:hypothetical protein [Polyangiaceae bacterium]
MNLEALKIEVPEESGGADLDAPRLHALAAAAIATARSISVAPYERPGADAAPLVTEVRAATDEAIRVLLAALEASAEPIAPSLDGIDVERLAADASAEVARRLDQPDGIMKITSIAFVARMALHRRLQAIDALARTERSWELIDACDSAAREALRCLGAFDLALCHHAGLPTEPSYYETELPRSLAVRHAYRVFHRDVTEGGPPSPDDIAARLRRTGAAIAKLCGRDIYPAMRVRDRHLLHRMQTRIHAWLLADRRAGSTPGDPDEGSPTAGVRLYQEIAGLADLMLDVNKRAELVEHDRRARAADAAAELMERPWIT